MSTPNTKEAILANFDQEIQKTLDPNAPVYLIELRDWLSTALDTYAEAVRKEERERKDRAYRERDMLVCALSKLFPAYLARHSEEDTSWENDWRWIVYIDLPTGQVSWHIHDSEREMFNHLEVRENNWDGHTTEEKYRRLAVITPTTH